jgi:hypothetical protein
MPPDGKEPESVWHGPNEKRDQLSQQEFTQPPADQHPAVDPAEVPPLPEAQPPEILHLSNPGASLEDEEPEGLVDDDVDMAVEPASAMSELLHNLGQFATLILVPLLFGGLTSLFVLQPVATNRAYIPPPGLLIVIAIIILIAIAQGMAVYYAGTNIGLWAGATLAGFLLFVLVGTFTIFGPLSGFLVFVLILALAALLGKLYFHKVPKGFVDIAFSSEKYSRTLYKGFNIRLPWEGIKYHLNVGETQWICPDQRIQLSRDEDVILRAVITYQLQPEDAYLAVNEIDNWEQRLREDFITMLQTIATTFSPNDFLTWPQGLHAAPSIITEIEDTLQAGPRWERINDHLFQRMRDHVALWGVQIRKVQIRDVVLVPHDIPRVDMEPTQQTPSAAVRSEFATVGTGAKMSPAAASEATEQMPSAPVKTAMPQANGRDTSSTPPKEDVLVQAYRAVQDGKITDPKTIRSIAAKFEEVANNPTWNQMVNFDAARAASNLKAQAERNEAQFGSGQIYNDKTQTDWTTRRPTDENLTAGG